jgi:hypothetical protein
VLKAFAIEERDKPKDSYDVIWMLNAYTNGPPSVVEEITKSPILGHGDVAVAVGYLRKNFAASIILDLRSTLGLNNLAAARRNVRFCGDTRMEP